VFQNRHKNKLLNKASKFIKTGGNLDNIDGWDELVKEYKLTPEDLKEK